MLDGDPLAVADAVFAAMPVAATLVAGRFTFRAASDRLNQPALTRDWTRLANGSRPYSSTNAAW